MMESEVPVVMTEPPSNSISLLEDTGFIEALRLQMVKFAALQLSDSHLAEDAVQEALIGAMKNVRSFSGRAALKTWVFAILKNKIADVLRKNRNLVNASSLLGESENDDRVDSLFDSTGEWQSDERPASWAHPEDSLHNREFWLIFEACLDHLPGQQARAFMMREFVELDTPEICSTIGITVTNLNVLLHRARLRLRACLENNWFLEGERSC